MSLAALHLAVIPVLAGLAVGGGAVANYVAAAPGDQPPVVSQASISTSCTAQVWPNIDRACLSGDNRQVQHQVRVVTAPRADEQFDARFNATDPNAGKLPPAFPGMTTSDGVLRGAQPEALAQTREKRTDRQRFSRKRTDARVARKSYRVPAERGGQTREVYVVRPMPFEFLR